VNWCVMLYTAKNKKIYIVFKLIIVCITLMALPSLCRSQTWSKEIYFYEVTWNGARAAHGDITTHRKGRIIEVNAVAVTDNPLKRVLDIWSKVQATFHFKTFKPKWYQYRLRSNLLRSEVVDLRFDHRCGEVTVSKYKGDSEEKHKEKIATAYDPVSAAFVLRRRMVAKRPTSINIYDGKDRARLVASPVGVGPLRVKGGTFRSSRWNFRVLKLTGDKREVAKGQLWVSDDTDKIPLLLTSRPVVGKVRFELVRVLKQRHAASAR
jgi:hypothetical protein